MKSVESGTRPHRYVLHNMSARPSTRVTRTVAAIRTAWVCFVGPRQPPPLNDECLARLDDLWCSYGLTGAVLLHPVSGDLAYHVRPVRCRDDNLTLNVLLRARGSLLLAAMPLLDDPTAVVGVRVATDDPRLVDLALPVAAS